MPHLEPRYHVHPHPQFCINDQWIVYTSTVHGRSDVALIPVSDLIEATV